MKIGIDIDGVLANFVEGFTRLTREITGRNLFPSSYEDGNAPVWDWPQHFGYTDEEMHIVWNAVKHSTVFWKDLSPFLPNILALFDEILSHSHDFYLVTNRFGSTAKQQTDFWIRRMFYTFGNYSGSPSVLISSQKGLIAQALQLDAYIDDNSVNCEDVCTKSPQTRTFVLDRPYNRTGIDSCVTRIKTLDQMFICLSPHVVASEQEDA